MDTSLDPNSGKSSSFSTGGMEFIRIPEGESIIGSYNDHYAYDDEYPQQKIDFAYSYAIAKYPVTNRQFQAFVEQSGFKTKAETEGGYIGFSRNNQANWRLPDGISNIDGKEEHPVVQINWLEAQEFCHWLNEQFASDLPAGSTFRLPTEVEWERAARGDDGRIYPWGNDFAKDNCNSNFGTTPVSMFSHQGDSPWGAADTAGNVWEWTSTVFSYQFKYPYRPRDGREAATPGGSRVIRGGGYQGNANMERLCRCACRSTGLQTEGEMTIGFRVAIAPPVNVIDKASIATLSKDFMLFAP